MKPILFLLFTLIVFGAKAQWKKDKGLIFTCVVSQTSTSCDVYTFDLYRDNTLRVKFGDRDWDSEQYSIIRSENEIKLQKDDIKKIKNLISEVKRMNSSDSFCREIGGWQIDIYLEDKRWNFCTGEQNSSPLGAIYQNIKRLSPIEMDLHWGGCPN